MKTTSPDCSSKAIAVVIDHPFHQTVVSGLGNVADGHASPPDSISHSSLEHAGGGPDGMVPIDVAVHLILGEQERLEGAHAFFLHTDFPVTGLNFNQSKRRQQAIDINRAVRHATHPGVTAEIINLVQINGAGNQTL